MRARPLIASLVMISLFTMPLLLGRSLANEEITGGTNFSGREFVRNGDFDSSTSGWQLLGTGTAVAPVGTGGGPGLVLEAITESEARATQQIHQPTTTTVARARFNFRMVPSGGGQARLNFGLVTNTAVLATRDASGIVTGDTGVQSFDVTLTAGEVAAIQSAHAAGEAVFFVLQLEQLPANAFKAYVDDVSLLLDGSWTYPSLSGEIAYVETDAGGNPVGVKRIRPDSTGDQRVWSYPDGSGVKQIFDLDWKNDGGEIAFVSNHEFGYSAFSTDIYAVRPDGGSLRRVSNPPSRPEIENGGFSFGSVSGRINNGWGTPTSFSIYVQGARSPVSHDPGNFQDQTTFTIDNVADLGAGVGQTMVLLWSSGSCPSGIEFAIAAVDPVAGQTVDAGTINFQGLCNRFTVSDINWSPDDSEIGFFLSGTARFVSSAGESIGRELFSNPGLSPANLDWGGGANGILYDSPCANGCPSTYVRRTSKGGDGGTELVLDTTTSQRSPVWLPGGNSFLFTYDTSVIGRHDLQSGTSTPLAAFFNESISDLSVDPGGNYAVFERRTADGAHSDVWVINLQKPVEMWPLTQNGSGAIPDWGPAGSPATPTSTPVPATSTPVPGATNTPTPQSTPIGNEKLYIPVVER